MGARPFHPPTCLAREGLRTRVCRAMRGPMSLRPMTPSFSLHATQAQLVAACIALLAPVPRAVIAFTGGSGVVVPRPTLRSVAAFPPVSSSLAVGPAASHLAKSDWRRGPNARSALHVLAMTAEGEVTGGQADGSEKKGWRSLFGKASRKDAGGQASDAQSTEGVRGEVADGAGEMLPNAAMIWSEGTKVRRTEGGGAEAAPGSGGREGAEQAPDAELDEARAALAAAAIRVAELEKRQRERRRGSVAAPESRAGGAPLPRAREGDVVDAPKAKTQDPLALGAGAPGVGVVVGGVLNEVLWARLSLIVNHVCARGGAAACVTLIRGGLHRTAARACHWLRSFSCGWVGGSVGGCASRCGAVTVAAVVHRLAARLA